MSEHELEKIKMKKAELLMKQKSVPNEIIKISSYEQFKKILQENDQIIIIDLWAVWCGPCMMFAPIFEQLQKEYGKEFIFLKVNVDSTPEIARQYGITGIPTTLFIRNGRVVNKIVGAMGIDGMRQVLEKMKDFNH